MRPASRSHAKEVEASSDHALPALDCEIDLDERTEIDPSPPTMDAPAIPERGAWVGPMETPAPPMAHQAPPQPAVTGPVSPQLPTGRRSLSEIWPEPPRKRRLPSRLQLALAGVGVVLVGVVAFGITGGKPQAQAAAPVDDDMVVSAEELKNRREVRADDFRPRGPQQPILSPAAPPVPAPATEESLAARRARRQSNPEDVLSLRARRGAASGKRGSLPADSPYYEGPVYVTAGSADSPALSASSPAGPSQRVAAAGMSIPAVLTSPLQLRGDSATVIAKVEGQTGPLRGARFVGTASAGSGRVTIHFRTIVLADGRQGRVAAEAQDEEGAFGLSHGADPPAKNDEPGSVVGDVAQETATDLVSTAIGFNIAGRAVDRYVNGSRTRRSGGAAVRTMSLPPGTKLQVFLHEAVDLGR